jgi:hypothetical protein
MAEPGRLIPFRRALTVDPYILPINSASSAVAVPIDKAKLQAAGVLSFKMYNPCPFWVWYRGWNKAADGSNPGTPLIIEKGHYLPPGAVDLNTSQVPDFIAALPQAEPGVPLPSDLATAGYRLVMIYGAGL